MCKCDFPWGLLSKYVSMSELGRIVRREVISRSQTAYCCSPGDIIDIDGELFVVRGNYAYDVVVESMRDGNQSCVLPSTACEVIGSVNNPFSEEWTR